MHVYQCPGCGITTITTEAHRAYWRFPCLVCLDAKTFICEVHDSDALD